MARLSGRKDELVCYLCNVVIDVTPPDMTRVWQEHCAIAHADGISNAEAAAAWQRHLDELEGRQRR